VIRCRNCHTDHVFVAVQGRIVHLENASSACRLPESSAVS
jgi:hypothetical protein